MTQRTGTAVPGGQPQRTAIPAQLEPDAIGVAQDTVIGVSNSAPVATMGLVLAGLAAATAYGVVPAMVLCAVAMLIIANSYRRLNLWNANCGASFEWVGRTINPYLGFFTGWLMLAANLIGSIAAAVVLGPSVLAIFGANANAKWPNIFIATGIIVVMFVIGVLGIRPTAAVQVVLAILEYGILILFSVWGLVAVLNHHPGTYPITHEWFTTTGVGGQGSLAAGLLIAVFLFAGWDGTIYVNEEVKHRRVNPGRAAVFAVAILAFLYILAQVGLQGVVSPAKLQANSSSAMTYVAQALGGAGWAKVMALALALSVSSSVGLGIVVLSRITYGMAGRRVLPPILGQVNRRFSTPAIATVVIGLVTIAATWAYLLSGPVSSLFTQLINVTGLLFAAYYILTAVATIAYYRRRLISNPWDGLMAGLLPLIAAGFLGWIVFRSLQLAPAEQRWTVIGISAAGILLMIVVRFTLRPEYFHIPRESASKDPQESAST
jgi:amino acid transporter